jgi:2-methylisocitrate lyase-like PEP mutase family enzyme
MAQNGSMARRLRETLNSGSMVVAPGAYDGMTAKLVESAGFEAVYMTGAGTAARFGLPDYGLATMTEMVDTAELMAESVSIPVIADADTGYGNELNVIRAVRAYERRGVAGIHIEDQVFPKRCGHLDGKEVIPIDAFARKIAAAVGERHDPDFVVIARTDSRTVLGFEAAVERCNAALAAGADVAFFESPLSRDEIIEIPKRVKGPCLFNMVHGGKTPLISLKEAEQFGYAITIVPALIFMTVMGAAEEALRKLKHTAEYPLPAQTMTVVEAFRKVGAADWDVLRNKYANESGADLRDAAKETV